MIRRPAPNALMFFLLVLAACSGSDDGGNSSAGQTQVAIVALPDDVGDAICSLTRHTTERDLIAIFGDEYRRYRQRVSMIVPFFGRSS